MPQHPRVSWRSKEHQLEFDIWEVCQKYQKGFKTLGQIGSQVMCKKTYSLNQSDKRFQKQIQIT